MYSQSYFPQGKEISLPDNYDGTAFSDDNFQNERTPKIEARQNEIKFSPKDEECESPSDALEAENEECIARTKESRGGLFGIDLKGMFSSLFGGNRFSSIVPKDFGTEEILIIGIALFLLFSSERDIECALLLLALIFIK